MDLLVGLGAGAAGALLATVFTYLAHFERRAFRLIPVGTRPVVGGLALGGLAFLSPYALTFGEGQIQHIAVTKLAVATLAVAIIVKLVASSTMVSAGWRGGFIIPLFFVGAALGSIASRTLGVDKVVAMTALMAATNVGVTKTPFGSTLVVAEMAGMQMLPSTLLAAVISLFLTSRVSMIETQRERGNAYGTTVDTSGAVDADPATDLVIGRTSRTPRAGGHSPA
jgi:H+/Cl- antiporter ClcA